MFHMICDHREIVERAVQFALLERGFKLDDVSPTIVHGVRSAISHFDLTGRHSRTNPPVAELGVLAYAHLTSRSRPQIFWKWNNENLDRLQVLTP